MAHAPDDPPPWTPPIPFHSAHFPLVLHAWSVVSVDGEEQVKRWRVMMQDAFVQWRDQHGTAPTDDTGPGAFGLLGNPYIGRPVQECPPNVCAGPQVKNYFDLLMKLIDDNDPGITALIADITLYKALAVLVLTEVHDHPSGVLEAAYATLRDIEATQQRQQFAAQHKVAERLVPLAVTGQAFKRGNPKKGGSKSSLQHMVTLICDRIGSTDYDDVWRFLADKAQTEDLYAAGHTAFKFQGVSDDGQDIEFVRQRDLEDPPDPFERMTPATLRKCLRRIRKRESRDT